MTATRRTTAERGYDGPHQRERRRLDLTVQAGRAYCQQGLPGNGSSGTCIKRTRWIQPGTRWALGHNDQRTAWIGTCHHACNQHDGAVKGGRVIAARRYGRHPTPHPTHLPPWRSRTW